MPGEQHLGVLCERGLDRGLSQIDVLERGPVGRALAVLERQQTAAWAARAAAVGADAIRIEQQRFDTPLVQRGDTAARSCSSVAQERSTSTLSGASLARSSSLSMPSKRATTSCGPPTARRTKRSRR